MSEKLSPRISKEKLSKFNALYDLVLNQIADLNKKPKKTKVDEDSADEEALQQADAA